MLQYLAIFFGSMVELPLTLPQDHTLFEILQHKDIHVWQEKMDWILRHGGVAVLNIHPDYMLSDDRLALYRDLLVHIKSLQGVWHVQPREAARWWRDRQSSTLRMDAGGSRIEGPAAGRGSIVVSRMGNDGVVTHNVAVV